MVLDFKLRNYNSFSAERSHQDPNICNLSKNNLKTSSIKRSYFVLFVNEPSFRDTVLIIYSIISLLMFC